MTPFSARDPRKIAAFGLLGFALLFALGLRASDLPFLNPARVGYFAELSDAGGLRAGDPVEVAGVLVGRVDSIEVERDRVVVEFAVDKSLSLGDQTTAAIKVGSVLGSKYLELETHGASALRRHATIPLSRTTPAYDVVAAFAELTEVGKRLDTNKIATALDTLSSTFQNSPAHVRGALRGLSRFSHTIASRDSEIKELIHHTAITSRVLDERKGDVAQLVTATNLLLDELDRRRSTVHQLLVNTTALADELAGLVKENQAVLTPALTRLETVTRMLQNHQNDLRSVIRNLNAYGQTFNNVIGTGPWFDVLIPRLPNSVHISKAR